MSSLWTSRATKEYTSRIWTTRALPKAVSRCLALSGGEACRTSNTPFSDRGCSRSLGYNGWLRCQVCEPQRTKPVYTGLPSSVLMLLCSECPCFGPRTGHEAGLWTTNAQRARLALGEQSQVLRNSAAENAHGRMGGGAHPE